MTTTRWIAIIAVLGLFTAAADAEWSRTRNAFDTRTPAEGKIQAEGIGGMLKGADGTYDLMYMELVGRYGLCDNWSIEVEPGFSSFEPDEGDKESGIGDTLVLTKYRFLDEAKNPLDMAAGVRVNLPTGDEDKGLGTGSVEPEVILAAAKTLGPIVAVASASYAAILDSREFEKDGILWACLEGVYTVSERVLVTTWVDGRTTRWEGTDDEAWVGASVRFLPQERILLAVRGEIGLTDDTTDWDAEITAGYEF
jgi:hypothetical protein